MESGGTPTIFTQPSAEPVSDDLLQPVTEAEAEEIESVLPPVTEQRTPPTPIKTISLTQDKWMLSREIASELSKD